MELTWRMPEAGFDPPDPYWNSQRSSLCPFWFRVGAASAAPASSAFSRSNSSTAITTTTGLWLGDHNRLSAGEIDQPAETILGILRGQGLHAIPALLALIFGHYGRSGNHMVGGNPSKTVVTASISFFFGRLGASRT
jgi:hypothetical protein